MTNDRTIPWQRRALGYFGLGLLGMLAGCSAEEHEAPGRTVEEASAVVRETCADNPLLAGCRSLAAPASAGPAPATRDPAALARAAAQNVLSSNCGYCHGPALDQERARAGMNYIDDVDHLVERGQIVPGNSARSRIVQRMLRGEMPPPSSGFPRVTRADITIVSDYIDNPLFWPPPSRPAPEPAPRDCTGSGQVLGFDQLFRLINADLLRADGDDTRFFRYVSLTNRYTAGVCAEALDGERQALTKMLNMLSVRPRIAQPVAINEDRTVYRLDLRDFDWDRAIAVAGQSFGDVWEAIAARNPYAVPFVGDAADEAVADTQTERPLLFADQMLNVAVIGNLYYAIIGVDTERTLSEFIAGELGIDVRDNLEREDAMRAGTTRSRISRQDRVVERHDLGVRGGVLWQSFDFAADQSGQSIFDDPFGFSPGGTEAIFTLPNGMLGFIIADESGNIVEDSDILLDTNQADFRAVTAVSCSNCHAGGFIPVEDEVGAVALANARRLRLTRDEIEQLESIYVSSERFAQQVEKDSQGFYQRALQQAELPVQGGDPVSRVFLRFDADLSLADAAGDLGVTPEELAEDLDLLDPALAVLRQGTLDRDDFSEAFVASLCRLSSAQENRPDPALCAEALASRGE